MDLGYLPDVVRNDVIDFDSVPDTAKQILALRMIGMGGTKIARLLKIQKTTVYRALERYDPDGECNVDPEMKRKITSEMLMTTGISALLEITDEKLKDMDAEKLTVVATRCINTAEKIRALTKVSSIKETSRVESLMASLEIAQIEEV